MKICPEHDKPFSDKSPNKVGNYWHVIDFEKNEYCSKTKEEYDTISDIQEETRESAKTPDWDAIAEGKVRHGFAIEAFKLGMPLNDETKKFINEWIRYVMEGR